LHDIAHLETCEGRFVANDEECGISFGPQASPKARDDRTTRHAARATGFARLRRAVIVDGGRVVRQRDYAEATELTLEIVMEAGTVRAVYLLGAAAFESNLNQMYFLGRFDPTRFEEAFNNFPYARAFRVLPTRD